MIYNHKLINDLAWVINSPCLIAENDRPDSRLLPNQWFNEQYQISQSLLSEHDRNPQIIQSFLSQMPAFKLGSYFEKLIYFWLDHHPDFSIINSNLILSHDKRTLGEMDFILTDHTGRLIHLEVAVKFYLQITDKMQSYWVGPNIKDRLDIKLKKLMSQQIELSKNPLAKKQLEKLNLPIDEHWVMLKGRLFKHDTQMNAANSWLTLDDFKRCQHSDTHWVILDKTHWLATINNVNEHFLPNAILYKNDLINAISDAVDRRPVCVAQIDHHRESKRFFITANNWQQTALNSIV
ncbi:MAG: DUF1853 family protein [Gammaproteobacteria bacterium]|nr:DUF1853 family protein [Gammaproteobacteria bacterium]